MAFLNEHELKEMNFKKIGRNIKISKKACFYYPESIEIGDHSRIDDFCIVSGKIKIGKNVHIGVFSNLAGGEKGIFIDDFCGLSYGTHVFSQSDDYTGETLTNPTIPDEYTRVTKRKIHIKKHSIVGASSIIMPGVVLAQGTSIGANSLVTKSTSEWSIYFGSPAKRRKSRKRNLLAWEKKYRLRKI